MVHLFKIRPDGLQLMTEVRTFSSTSKIVLIFKNAGKKTLSDFSELLPVALVRAHVQSRPNQPAKKNTPPVCEMVIDGDEGESKNENDSSEVAEITLE